MAALRRRMTSGQARLTTTSSTPNPASTSAGRIMAPKKTSMAAEAMATDDGAIRPTMAGMA
jgi:hypothetical protein